MLATVGTFIGMFFVSGPAATVATAVAGTKATIAATYFVGVATLPVRRAVLSFKKKAMILNCDNCVKG